MITHDTAILLGINDINDQNSNLQMKNSMFLPKIKEEDAEKFMQQLLEMYDSIPRYMSL